MRFRDGWLDQAVTLQTSAVKHALNDPIQAERLATYRAVAGQAAPPAPSPAPPAATLPVEPAEGPTFEEWKERLAGLDFYTLGKRLTREGCLLLAGLVDPDTCALLRSWFHDDARFSKTVVMDRPDYGRGTYRYFRQPPPVVDGLRRAVYPHVARIANEWQRLLGEQTLFPEQWEGFRDVCHAVGQSSPTPILLRYEPGGFNALHRDLRGQVFFPIQLAVVLSPALGRRDRRRLRRRRLCAVRRAGERQVPAPRPASRPGRCDPVLHPRSAGVGRRNVWVAAGDARRHAHHAE